MAIINQICNAVPRVKEAQCIRTERNKIRKSDFQLSLIIRCYLKAEKNCAMKEFWYPQPELVNTKPGEEHA